MTTSWATPKKDYSKFIRQQFLKLENVSANHDKEFFFKILNLHSIQGNLSSFKYNHNDQLTRCLPVFDFSLVYIIEFTFKNLKIKGLLKLPSINNTINHNTSINMKINLNLLDQNEEIQSGVDEASRNLYLNLDHEIMQILKTIENQIENDLKPIKFENVSHNPINNNNKIESNYGNSYLHLSTIFETCTFSIYNTFRDPSRIMAWSKFCPNMYNKDKSLFSLFNGKISGEILFENRKDKIKLLWRLNHWNANHFANCDILFTKTEDKDNKSKCDMIFIGIPIGEELNVKNVMEIDCFNAIKSTFGFGVVS